MNILKRICSISLAAILVMGIASFPANAQFKGLGNKLKSKAEKAVKDKVDKKKKKAEEAVENAVSGESSESGSASESTTTSASGKFDYKKTYTPGAEAKASDPLATSTEVWNGFTKSVGALHGAYDNMGDFTQNYQPYYADKNKDYWILNEDSRDRILNAFLAIFKTEMASDINHKKTLNIWGEVGDGMVVPADEIFLNAFQTQFIADPTSDQALLFYIYADTYLNHKQYSQMRYALADNYTTEEGGLLPKNFYEQRKARRELADNLSNTVTSYETLISWAEKYYDNAAAQSDPYAKYFQLLLADNITDNCLPNHKDHDAEATRYRKLVVKKNQSNGWQAHQAFVSSYFDPNEKPDWMPNYNASAAIAEPKGVTASAADTQGAQEAAKQFAGRYYKKVVFINNKWGDIKSKKWPYEVTGKSTWIYIIAEHQGQKYALKAELIKRVGNMSGYRISLPVGTMAQPCK